MILFFECGRLGNQLLQYHGIRKHFPDHRLIFFGFSPLFLVVNQPAGDVIPMPQFRRSDLAFRFVRVVVKIAVRLRIFGMIEEQQKVNQLDMVMRRGLLNILHLRPSYFQHRSILEEAPQFRVRDDICDEASLWLNRRGIDPQRQTLVFLHIRRGDYVYQPSRNSPAVLGLAWYQKAIHHIRSKVENPIFLVMSDDMPYVRDFFQESDEMVFSDNNQNVDLAIMGKCTHGILSASSFSLCGAWMARYAGANVTQSNGHFIAPLHWIGHRSGSWFPQGVNVPWITYI